MAFCLHHEQAGTGEQLFQEEHMSLIALKVHKATMLAFQTAYHMPPCINRHTSSLDRKAPAHNLCELHDHKTDTAEAGAQYAPCSSRRR